ncbi:ferredoxin [Cytophagaceae bacterium ABcell3]|nr:ferredoxin [Cytophagaceae bacterium ABcell3]
MLQITYYRNKCIGCNGCVEAAPERWRISRADGKSNLINGREKKGIYTTTVNMTEYEENEQAAANCPMRIIKLKVL